MTEFSNSPNQQNRALINASAFLIILAGIIHLIILPQHWEHAPAHGLLFAVAGVAQIAWGVAFLRRPSPNLYYTGILMSGALIVLWILTRVLPAPFGHGPEEVDVFGIACKISEGLGLISLLILTASGRILGETKQIGWRTASFLTIVAIVGGTLTYGVALAAEPIFPWLAAPAGTHHHEETEEHHDHETPTESAHEH